VLVVIEGDPKLEQLTSLQSAFGAEGYAMEFAVGATRALQRLSSSRPSLLLLHSLARPSSWIDLCRQAREIAEIPIIIGFPLPSPLDAVLAFELGVTAYVSDARRVHELVARTRAALRSHAGPDGALSIVTRTVGEVRNESPVTADRNRREVRVRGRLVHLSRLEFDLLTLLMDTPGQVRSRQEILDAVWGSRSRPGSRSLYTHIRRLRAKLEDDPRSPRRVVTVHGFGVRFDQDPAATRP
jgi:two-component system response regulator RegX3